MECYQDQMVSYHLEDPKVQDDRSRISQWGTRYTVMVRGGQWINNIIESKILLGLGTLDFGDQRQRWNAIKIRWSATIQDPKVQAGRLNLQD